MQIVVYLVKTHLLLYDNRSASLKLHFKQCTPLGLLETFTQLCQSLTDAYFYIYFVSDFTAIFKITATATGERKIR